MTKTEVKTIMEFLAENPQVDVSAAWKRCWGIQTGIVDRVRERFPCELHPSCEGREYYTSPDGAMEGSFQAYSSPEVPWLVHSWIGNRHASILDINATVFLGEQNRVPHLAVIFGTIPRLFFYAEYTPRVDLRVNPDYLERYYEPANAAYLEFQGNPAFTQYVSHGAYLRALMSPVCISHTAELTDANIDLCEQYLEGFLDRWFGWLDEAEPVPEEERAAQRDFDFRVRELGYRLDPMNVLPQKVFGEEEFQRMLELRIGTEQIREALAGS